MANSTDPFGKSVFGGQTSLSGQVPRGTSAVAKPAPYKWAGQGWNDPLAQQIYSKYSFGGRGFSPEATRRSAEIAGGPNHPGVAINSPLDPTTWGGSNQGEDFNKMIDAYKAAGGQGLYSQLAATNPKAVGYPTDAAGNPLPRAGSTGLEYPQPGGGWSSTMTSAGQPPGGGGSTNMLSPDVLKKMWR